MFCDKVLLFNEEILRKSREKCQSSIQYPGLSARVIICYSTTAPSFFTILAVIYQTIQKTKEEILFQRYFSPVYISSLSLPYPSSLCRHIPIKQRFKKNKSTKDCHSDNIQPWPHIPQLGPWGSQAALNLPPNLPNDHQSKWSDLFGSLESFHL